MLFRSATGYSSGLTAKDVLELGDAMESSMLVTSEQVQDAAGVMATFRSVSGDTFTRAIKLSQDMAAVFGQDLQSSAMRLGKALEDPINGLTALRRVGVVFTQGQHELIKSLVETGDVAGAQKVILDALAAKVGGAGAAEATGLTGATHRLGIAWKNMLETIGQTETVSGAAEAVLRRLSTTFEVTMEWFKKDSISVQLQKAKNELADVQKQLEWLQNLPPLVEPIYKDNTEVRQKRAAVLRKEIEALTAAEAKEASERKAAEEGRVAAEKDNRAEVLAEQRKKIDDALDKLMNDPAEKIAKVNAELATTKKQLDNLREKDGSNNPAVDAAIKQAEALARRQIDAVQKPLDEATQKAAEANQKVIDGLKMQLLGLGNARQAAIDQAVSRLSDKASNADRVKVRDLAAQLFDQKSAAEVAKVMADLGQQIDKLADKRKAFINQEVAKLPETATQDDIERTKQLAAAVYDQTQAEEKLDKLRKEGQELTEKAKTTTEGYAAEIAHLTELLNAGAISQEVFNKSKAKADDAFLEGRTDPQAGAIRAFHKYQKEGEDAASAVEKAFTTAMSATEDAIVGFVTSGGKSLESLDKLANSIVEDITRMFVQKSITGPLFKFLGNSMENGGFMDQIFSSIFHAGGVAGDPAPMRQVPSYVFAGAPRYHSGGIAGLQPGEIPAILQRGEVVLPKGSNQTNQPVSVVMHISTPDANSFRASQSQIAAEAARGIGRARRNL